MKRADRILADLDSRGFDISRVSGRTIYPRCSQCEVLVINGVACHETGCPHETHECKGCNAIVPARQKYCSDCQ